MILCPNCLHKEMLGAFFCSECGAQLVYSEGVPTSTIKTSSNLFEQHPDESKENPLDSAPPFSYSDSIASLNMITTGDMIPISGDNEFTLGRASEGQPVAPNIDLTPYKAYESGVSRMHASLRIIDDEIMVTDLGSANGTRINGRKITSQIPHPIKHGDILTLGKFKIQILLNTK
jgi:hypothetical protein